MAVAAIGGWQRYFLGGRLETFQVSESAMPTAAVEFDNSSVVPLDGLMIALIIFMVLDYATGLMSAIVDKKLSSEVGFKGICRKELILMLVGVDNVVDIHIVGTGSTLHSAVICFYRSNEDLSLLENAAHIGLPIPDKDQLDKKDLEFLIERITVYEDHIGVQFKTDVDALLHVSRSGAIEQAANGEEITYNPPAHSNSVREKTVTVISNDAALRIGGFQWQCNAVGMRSV